MMAALAFSLTVAAKGQSRGLLSQVIPSPTGTNGYEEYLKAAEIADSKAFREFRVWNAPRDFETRGKPPAGLSETMTPLARKIYEVRVFGEALKLIAAGNAKPTSRGPNEMGAELPRFSDLADLAIDASYVAYSKGDWKGGTDQLLNVLVFASNASKEYLIGQLYNCESMRRVFAAFDAHKGQWSPADCQRITKTVNELLNQEPPVAVALNRERDFALSALDAAVQGGEPSPLDDESEKALNQRLRGLNASDRSLLKAMLSDKLAKHFEELGLRLKGPERTWIVKGPSEAAEDQKQDLATLSDICQAVLSRISPFEDAFPIALRTRVQLKLLKVHADIQSFRWSHGRLPAQLIEATTPEDRLDPLNGASFRFEHTDSGYRVISSGLAGIGEIQLTYVKPRRAAE